MTEQYLVGEFSLHLANLQTVAADDATARKIARLRRESERTPPASLTRVMVRALRLLDALCWDSVRRGDATAFDCQAAVSAELYEFGACAGLLDPHNEP